MDDQQLLRYSRHILLPQIGIEGQEKLLRARVLIVGAGGLGSPVALYLASAGVGRITLCDGDKVDLTNLQRQIVHRTESVGAMKAESAQKTLAAINPEVDVVALTQRVAGKVLSKQIESADVVIDASDNFPTRHDINRACVAHKKPLVSGACVRFDGQVAVFDMRDPESPCYNCLFPEGGEVDETPCAVLGIFAPMVGVIGSVQAAEALKILTGIGESLAGRLLLLDALSMEWRSIKLNKDPACTVCGIRR